MGFKKRKGGSFNYETPQEMYADYKNRKIQGLINYQSDVIDNYMDKGYDKDDVALELPTGSGKTLIGLVIGEFRRRKNKEKIVFLCPTKQLVNQVVDQAESKYGIKAYAFTGKQAEYDPIKSSDYNRAECIAVTTYSGLFNNNSFFKNADIIIFDDAHSSEDYIVSCWSVEINNSDNKELFKMLVENLKDILGSANYARMTEEGAILDQTEWCEKIPNLKLTNRIDEIKGIIDENLDDNIKYSWKNIRDKLQACNIFVSYDTILIRPYIPPTLTNIGFSNAKQRIYMSATLGVSGELERITGIEKIIRLPMVNGWDKKGLGRRFFIFPGASLSQDKINELEIKMLNLVDRTLVLVKDSNTAKTLKACYEANTNCEVFTNSDIEKTTKNFIESNKGVAILANRYDGIDLSGDQCRMLIIYNIPKSTHLQERFITSRMAASILFNERIKTKLIQAVGRCTRDAVDYSAVCIMGQDIINELLSNDKTNAFHPELQAEIEFGYDQYDQYKEPDDIIDNLKVFFEHSKQWEEDAEEEIINMRDELIKNNGNNGTNVALQSLRKSAELEVKYQYAMWREDYQMALDNIDKIITCLKENELKGYRGFWNYLGGCVSYRMSKQGEPLYEEKARIYFNNAAACSDSITWFNKLLTKSKSNNEPPYNNYFSDVIERIENEIYSYGIKNSTRFEKQANNIMTLLNSDGTKFEDGHELLGKILGYESGNSTEQAAPDPWWIINDDICIVAEDKIYADASKAIPVKDVREAKSHETWIREKIKSLNKEAKIITIFITNADKIEKSAVTFASNIYYVNKDEFIDWARHAINAIRVIRRNFIAKGDLIWRADAIDNLKSLEVGPRDYLSFITNKSLKDLEAK